MQSGVVREELDLHVAHLRIRSTCADNESPDSAEKQSRHTHTYTENRFCKASWDAILTVEKKGLKAFVAKY